MSKITNCTATASFAVTTYDKPTEENSINVFVGLFAGQNGGNSGSKAVISNCTFVSKGENTVIIYDDSKVNCNFGVCGKETTGATVVASTLPTEVVSVTITKYVKNADTNEYEVSGESTIVTIN